MFSNEAKDKGSDHEIIILLHLVQMVKAIRKIPDETIAERLGVEAGDVVQLFSESSKPTLEQLRQLFLAVGMGTDGIFETSPEQPGCVALAPDGFGNAIDRGLVILNEEGSEEEGGPAAGAAPELDAKRSRGRAKKE